MGWLVVVVGGGCSGERRSQGGAFSSLTSIIEASGHTEELLEGQRSGDQDTDGAFRASVSLTQHTHTHMQCRTPMMWMADGFHTVANIS